MGLRILTEADKTELQRDIDSAKQGLNVIHGVATTSYKTANEAQTTADEAMSKAESAESIAKGRATGYVFPSYEDLTVWLSVGANKEKLKLGDNLYIRALNVPDYWWDGFSIQPLETQKVDLTEYVKKDGLADLVLDALPIYNGEAVTV